MTFDENGADREPPELGGFFIGSKPDWIERRSIEQVRKRGLF